MIHCIIFDEFTKVDPELLKALEGLGKYERVIFDSYMTRIPQYKAKPVKMRHGPRKNKDWQK